MFGIPYAHWVITKDGLPMLEVLRARECPVCGERIVEVCDRDGELVTNNYGRHYEAEHDES